MRKISKIFFHCTGGPQHQTVASIRAWWRQLGWNVDGYHFLIETDGTIHNLVPIEKPSNGVKGHNAEGLHISYIGGVDAKGRASDTRTEAQKLAMQALLEEYSTQYPQAVILGHRDVSKDKNGDGVLEPWEWDKSCPSFDVATWLREIQFVSKAAHRPMMTTTRVNIRTGPGVTFPTVSAALSKNIQVKYIADSQGWTYVSIPGSDITGWVKSTYLG